MRRLHLALAFTLALLAGAIAPGTARATAAPPPADVVTTWLFTGDCDDCFIRPPLCLDFCLAPQDFLPVPGQGIGTGLLTLRNYTPGAALTPDNFISFEYSSVLITISEAGVQATGGDLASITGTLPANGGLAGMTMTFVDGWYFTTQSDGFWCANVNAFNCLSPNDIGFNHTWETVPEPATLALLGAGLLGLAAARRRKAA